MTTLTLLVKASNSSQLKQVSDLLEAQFESLDLDFKILGVTTNKWVQVSLSGEDEVIATNYLNKEIGTCPINIINVSKLSVLKGYVSKVDRAKDELQVDVGIFEPEVVQAIIPVACLQMQLSEGKKVELKRISELYGLHENLPLSVKVTDVPGQVEELPAELSEEQVEKFHSWQQSLLDRLIVLGSSRPHIEEVLERTGLNRDVIEIEVLGMFEHALTCKLGTDAAGLIPRIGRYMRYAEFIVFNPRKSLGFIGQ